MQVLVAVWVEVVQRVRVARVPIGHREVDSECEIDLAPAEDVLQERVLPLYNKFLQLKGALVFIHLELCGVFLELGKLHGEVCQVLMFTAWDGSEEFKLDLSLNFILAEVCGAYLNLVPFKDAAFGPLNLRLVDWCVLSWRQIPVNDKEAKSGIR